MAVNIVHTYQIYNIRYRYIFVMTTQGVPNNLKKGLQGEESVHATSIDFCSMYCFVATRLVQCSSTAPPV